MIQKRKRKGEKLIQLGMGRPVTAAASVPETTATVEPPVQPEPTESPSLSATATTVRAVTALPETAAAALPETNPQQAPAPSPSASTAAIPETNATSSTETTAMDKPPYRSTRKY